LKRRKNDTCGRYSRRFKIEQDNSWLFIKTNSPKLVVVAKNIPEDMKKEIEHNVKVSGSKLEIFNGSSKELGLACGKPFPVTTLVIKCET